MSVHTSETNVPFLVVAYLLVNPYASLDAAEIERRFGMSPKNSASNLRTAVMNGLVKVEKRSRGAHTYRAGDALQRVREALK